MRLPENFVERPEALEAVKQKLLAEDERALVVSAISGLGGLGKSVLATALVRDKEVQRRFPDGILWKTLGQKPNLQTDLGDWIRELDKSREAFSANTLESASNYLHTLLAERQMLLVVDDVWNAAHAKPFRVGGPGCRVLVTTREAQLEGADYYSLDLMSEADAVDLVEKKLKQQLPAEEKADIKAFAKALGYLPLALDLAANQVRDGLSWQELQTEFEAERRSVALRLLDSLEAWDCLKEDEQRQYSLQACFNLSLKRLNAKQLQQFAWLGVLPEDVNLTAATAAVLWSVSPVQAKRLLALFRQRSFLTDGSDTFEGKRTYRVHDLMHDMARGLIEEGRLEIQNSECKIQNNLAAAHWQFLEHYQKQARDGRWDQLPNDGYIYRYLTWHMEQAEWTDEIHALLAMSDEQGRNAWFEACDRIGQPAIFVDDVARGWRLAEALYEQEPTRSIVLQCRYALITATLNSLVANLPIDLMAEFVKQGFWTVEQAWAYVEQIQAGEKIGEAIRRLAPYLSKPLFRLAIVKARAIESESWRAYVLSALAQIDGADFAELLSAARAIEDEYSRANVLSALAQIDGAYFDEALSAARAIESESRRAYVLRALAQIDGANLAELLSAARAIEDEYRRASVLRDLAGQVPQNFLPNLQAEVSSFRHKPHRALALSGYLSRLPLGHLPHADWQTYLHLLAHRKRSDLMDDLVTLYPAITHLGGDSAMRSVVEAMREVCHQWK